MDLALDGARTLAKVQKNAQLDTDLCDVLDDLQGFTGATHSRIVTAAILKYLFSPLQPPPSLTGFTDERIWMKLAVELESGDFTIYEIPSRILDRSLELSELAIAELDRQSSKEAKERSLQWTALRGAVAKLKRRWNSTVADFKGERMALRRVLERGGFPTLQAVGYLWQYDWPLSEGKPTKPADA